MYQFCTIDGVKIDQRIPSTDCALRLRGPTFHRSGGQGTKVAVEESGPKMSNNETMSRCHDVVTKKIKSFSNEKRRVGDETQ